MMWQCKTMLSGPPEFIPPFIPRAGTRDEVFIWQNFQPAYRDLGNRASLPSHMNTSVENFTKELEVRRDLGNQASPVNRAYMRGPKLLI